MGLCVFLELVKLSQGPATLPGDIDFRETYLTRFLSRNREPLRATVRT